MGSEATPPLVTCIYCAEDRPPSKEHALQRCIGGSLTLPRVCEPCNGRMSIIDQHVADNALVTMSRVANTPASAFGVKLGGEQFTSDPTGRTLPVRIVNGYRAEVQPMLRFVATAEGTQVEVILSHLDERARMKKFIERHAKTGFERLHVKRVDWLGDAAAALVMHRRDDGYLAVSRPEFEGRGRSFLRKEAGSLGRAVEGADQPASSIPNPQVKMSTEVRLNDLFRGVTKIAFNLLAARTQHDAVLHDRYNDVRAYVLGDDVRDELVNGVAAPDSRFATLLQVDEPMVFGDYQHVVVLGQRPGEVFAMISLYRSLEFLVTLPGPENEALFPHGQVAVFKGDRTESRWLSLEETAQMVSTPRAVDR